MLPPECLQPTMAPSLPSPLLGAPSLPSPLLGALIAPLLLLLLLGDTTATPSLRPTNLNLTLKFSFPIKLDEEPRSLAEFFNPYKVLAKNQFKEHKTKKRIFENSLWDKENSDGHLIKAGSVADTVSEVGVLKGQQAFSGDKQDLGWKGSMEVERGSGWRSEVGKGWNWTSEVDQGSGWIGEVGQGWTWRSMADYYLCSSGDAGDIRDALALYWPYHQWFVLVTRPGYPYYMEYYHGEAHQASKCGRSMVVWHTLPPSFPDNCPASLAREASYVINKAIGYYKTPKDVVIASDKGGRSLDGQLRPHFIVAWAPGGYLGWASWSYGSCQVANQQAVYYVWP